MSVRERIREQPLPGEAEAAARSWSVVEAALAEQTPARRARRPRRLRAPAGARGGSPVRGSRRGTHTRRRRGGRLDRGSLRRPAQVRGARLRRPAPGRVRTRDLALGRVCGPSGRQLAPARFLRGCGLVAAGPERRGNRRPPGGGHGPGGHAQVVRRASRPREPSGVEHRPRLLRGLSRGRRAAERRGQRRGRPRCCAAARLPSRRRGAPTSTTCSCTRASAADSRRWTWRAGPRSGTRKGQTALTHTRQLAWSRDGRRLVARSPRGLTVLDAERSRASDSRGAGSHPAARAPSLGHAGRRGRGECGRHARPRHPAGRYAARRGSSSRATWTASHGRATAAACCSRGATPTSGSCSARTAACAGRCTA